MAVNPEKPGDLARWLREWASSTNGTSALKASDGSAELSLVDVEQRSAALAAGLKNIGLKRGDSIAIWLPNDPLWMVVHFAAARAGLLTVPINTWHRDSEVSHLLRLGSCKAIFVNWAFRDIDFAGILSAAVSAMEETGEILLRWVITVGEGEFNPAPPCQSLVHLSIDEIEKDGRSKRSDHCENAESMIAFSTSGTTSMPKLAVHGERQIINHAKAVARKARITPGDTVLAALPPCGAYGYGLILAAMAGGARVIQCKDFDVDLAINLIKTEKISLLALTEPILRKLLDHPMASRETFASLRIAFSAGATLQPVVERAAQDFGFYLSNVYGSSEVLALAAFWGDMEPEAGRSMAGGHLVSDGMRVRAVNNSDKVVEPNTAGELQFSGPIVTSGYLSNSEATAAAFTGDGWYRSQDLGVVLDAEGRTFHYVARMNDAIRIKGFLVNPGEIEDMLQKHPDVTMAQVIGLPDKNGEDVAVAFVTLNSQAQANSQILRDYCRRHMASYKIPAALHVIDAFPMTRSANGDKVVKKKLRELAKGLIADG